MKNVISINRGYEANNRRSYPREPCKPRLFEGIGRHVISAKDISLGGLRLVSNTKPIKDSIVSIVVKEPENKILLTLNTKVVWSKEGRSDSHVWEFGAEFLPLSYDEQKLIRYLIYQLQENRILNNEQNLFLPLSLVQDKEELDTICQQVKSQHLSELIRNVAHQCSNLSPRPVELWQWCYSGLEKTTLSSVATEWLGSAHLVKLLSIIFFTTIDDIADTLKDRELFQKILKNVFGHSWAANDDNSSSETTLAIERLSEIWRFIKRYLQMLPRYSEMKDLFFFDYANLIRGVEYALLVNEQPSLLNPLEGMYQQAYEVHIIPNLMIDLMSSPDFDMKELGKLREIGWYAQNMCRIANWLRTWEREVRQRDYTSGIVPMAIEDGIITIEELTTKRPEELIIKIRESNIENKALSLWSEYRVQIQKGSASIYSLNIQEYLKGIEHFFRMQVACNSILYN